MNEQINVLSELERIGCKYEWASEDEVRCRCPFHDDETPSCCINVKKRMFNCQTAGCKKSGDFISFLARILKTTRVVVLTDLGTRYRLDTTKVINTETVERYHKNLAKAGPLVSALRERGVTESLTRKYRLGEKDGRITIPIKNEGGLYVNVRRYLPGAPGNQKMRNTKGHGKIRLFPIDQLSYDEILLCGGEIKAIVAAEQLNKHGIGAISTTAGEGNWDSSFTSVFQNKKIWVCMDVDEEGQTEARNHCHILSRVATWIGNIRLPLDSDRYPHGDVNDFVATEQGDLFALLQKVEEWVPETLVATLSNEEPTDIELIQAVNAKIAGQRIRFKAVISAMGTAPYVIPKEITIDCDESQRECLLCPIYGKSEKTFNLHPEHPAILEMVESSKSVQREALMYGLGIPLTCKVCEMRPDSFFNVEDIRVSPQLEITSRNADRVMQPAVCLGDLIELNEAYEFTGRMYPHPKSQQSTLLLSQYVPTRDALSTYVCHDLDTLRTFQPDEWTVKGLKERLDGIYSDLEANVTRIFQRRSLHFVIDLAYHSPLFIDFDDRRVKGWVEVLVLGDSSQGKSETALNLMRHYGLGEKVECKNASVAGLLGGLQQMGSRWFVTWGVIPTHDKRLVILEELKGASTEIIAKLTEMRSSGFAEIPKIEKRRTHARTRLVALSNPRSDMLLSSYNFGIEAIPELVGGLEDVRRFDCCLLLSSSDIDPAVLNTLQRHRPTVDHVYDSERCRSLILWTWTRQAAKFEDEATTMILDSATELGNEFTDAVPLIDKGSTRFKIARLAAGLAGRTFSCQGEDLVVRPCHVEYIVDFLRTTYRSDVFGYADFTAAVKMTQDLKSPDEIQHYIGEVPYPRDFIEQMLHNKTIDAQDIQDWCAWNRMEAAQMMSFLVRRHALVRDGRAYRKTAVFIRLLKTMLAKGKFTDRPDFIPEEF